MLQYASELVAHESLSKASVSYVTVENVLMARFKLSSATELCNVSGIDQRSRCPQATLLGSLIYLFYVNVLMYTLPRSASLKIFANYVKFIYLSVVTYKRNLKVKFARLLQIRKISPFERGSAEQQLKLFQTLCFT